MVPQNPASPPVNASVSTSGAPKVVSRLFFGAPASVRPICLSIIINFLSSTSLGACADRLATLYVCRVSERSDRPLDRIEDAGDSCDVKAERLALARKSATRRRTDRPGEPQIRAEGCRLAPRHPPARRRLRRCPRRGPHTWSRGPQAVRAAAAVLSSGASCMVTMS
jgi:hypothetical protein